MYNTKAQLKKMLKDCCIRPEKIRSRDRIAASRKYDTYKWVSQKDNWNTILSYSCFFVTTYITRVTYMLFPLIDTMNSPRELCSYC